MTKGSRKRSTLPVHRTDVPKSTASGYADLVGSITELLEEARRTSARAVNALITATYWEIGRRIVEFEQEGKARAKYGVALLKRLSEDLSARFGRGFSERNLEQMRLFYLTWPISQTLSAESEAGAASPLSPGKSQILSADSLTRIAQRFPLPWSAYVRLLSVKSEEARRFYEAEALRGGWSVRQLGRFTHTDAGQMHVYLNYAAEHWTLDDENPPVGLILCAQKNEALARYALDNLPNKVLAAEYRTTLPDEKLLAAKIAETRRRLEGRRMVRPQPTERKRDTGKEGA